MFNFNRTTRNASHAGAPKNNGSDNNSDYAEIRDRVHERLLSEFNPTTTTAGDAEVHSTLDRFFSETLAETGFPLSRSERAAMLDRVTSDLLGLGPLEPLLRDDSVTEVLVNGPKKVYVERKGILERTSLTFASDEDVMRIVERILAPIGRRVDESSPLVDARLPDGSRVNVIIPPLVLNGPCISIRKFARTAMTVDDLVRVDTLTTQMAEFLRACVLARLNIVISGGTSTGKTTLLNVLSTFLPGNERIVTIEDAAELQLQQEHVIRMEARPANVEGKGAVAIRQLVTNALRMRPDRIVVGEVRGGEALDMLQAMNTGHDGSLTTVHSNSARDSLGRVETMVLMAGLELPLRAIREQIASAFDVVVHLDRLVDGTRKVVQIAEVQAMEGDVIVMQDIFRYAQSAVRNGQAEGRFRATGVRPKFMERIESMGLHIPAAYFAG